jgi:hypothetical protein
MMADPTSIRLPLEVTPDELAAWSAVAPPALTLAGSEAMALRADHPFLSIGTWRAFVVEDDPGQARVVAGIDPRQRDGDRQVGTIGFAAAEGATSVLGRVVDGAIAWLGEQGASVIRGPVQLSTWYGHRLPIDDQRSALPPFPFDPVSPSGLADVLRERGFRPVHTAESYLVDLERSAPETAAAAARVARMGITDRPLRVDQALAELSTLHAIASASFQRSWGFSPISLSEFTAIYQPLLGRVDHELVRIAHDPDGAPVGFVFAILPPGGPLVVKTIAVDPVVRRHLHGIGWLMIDRVHDLARRRGRRQALHALMAHGSYPARISGRWGPCVRRYATLERA